MIDLDRILRKRKMKEMRKIVRSEYSRHRRHKKRMKKNGMFDKSDITLYDLWILKHNTTYCSICGCKMSDGREMTDNQKSLDHIIPLFLGGKHMKNNIRFICRKCNCERDYNDVWENMRII